MNFRSGGNDQLALSLRIGPPEILDDNGDQRSAIDVGLQSIYELAVQQPPERSIAGREERIVFCLGGSLRGAENENPRLKAVASRIRLRILFDAEH